ncbi:MAG: glycosyltransferase family 2 protein [Nocardioides sp.]|uniref:glycosyltransferase n=1 Tax=Nocardioides sp. TaxID=35761 RepID=UPI0039E27C3F
MTQTPDLPRAAVLVLSYRTSAIVSDLLVSLSRTPSSERLVVSVVDNSVDDVEFDELMSRVAPFQGRFAQLRVTRSPSNGGYATGNNLAFRAVADEVFDWVFVINPDVTVDAGDLLDTVADLDVNRPDVYGFRTLQHGELQSGLARMSLWTGRTSWILHGEEPPSKSHSIVYAAGHCFATSRRTWEQVGGLHEDFFLYCEEAEYALAVELLGGRSLVLEGLSVCHASGISTGSQQGKSALTAYNATRSAAVLLRLHRRLAYHLPVLVVVRSAWAATYAVRGRGSIARAILRGLISGTAGRLGLRSGMGSPS